MYYAGKRLCLGESLARNTHFLFTSGLLKAFRFEKVAGDELPSLEPIGGLVQTYRPFRAMVIPR